MRYIPKTHKYKHKVLSERKRKKMDIMTDKYLRLTKRFSHVYFDWSTYSFYSRPVSSHCVKVYMLLDTDTYQYRDCTALYSHFYDTRWNH